ncbi:MAG: sulfatase-like hydrolase/transferase [Myxococcota bacterium]|nr:sulfatase-like hydrolase/transferase [Myxococcota bacterium]
MMSALLLGLLACGGASSIEPVPRDQAGESFAFAYRMDLAAELTLPENSRPDGKPAPRRLPVVGPFKLVRTVEGVQTWESPIPVRPRNLFFSRPPPGMALHSTDGESWRFSDGRAGDKQSRTWDFTANSLLIRVPKGQGKPEDGALELAYPRASEREASLNFDESNLSKTDFVSRSIQLGEDTRHGLFLPAPATAAWTVTVPPSGVLSTEAVVLPPEAQGSAVSDGATLRVEFSAADGAVEVVNERIEVGEWQSLKIDLSEYSGETGLLRFVSEPGESAVLDYLFLADPVLYTPVEDPKRVALIFIDTLRPDHMGIYGYERDTTPRLDEWAKGAVRFDNARTVAPWTLPSARSAFSGHQPEAWGSVPRLSEYFGSEGWATGAFVGNIYLSANFDMSPGWDTYNVVNWPIGEVQADKARGYLERHSDRDSLVMLHLMDMHLPYTEPKAYQDIWAGEVPEGLRSGSTRKPILQAYRNNPEEVRQWVVDRYDQNMRYLDDVLMDLFEDLGDQAPVLIFSDHGEEFWEHNEFEHGHSLYDELLKVPLVVKAPGLSGQVSSLPVSLLDVTPTTLALAGLRQAPTEGINLLPAVQGDAATAQQLVDRLQGFGRPLYGQERWGVLEGSLKWTSHQGKEEVYDLADDPLERSNQAGTTDLSERRETFERSLGREGGDVWRLSAGSASGGQSEALVIEVSHPEGFKGAWLGLDPLKRASMTLEEQSDGSYRIRFKRGTSGSREVFFLPNAAVTDFGDLQIRVVEGAEQRSLTVAPALVGVLRPDGVTRTLIRGRLGNRSMSVTFATSPMPLSEEEFEAFDAEVSEALKALGYVHD